MTVRRALLSVSDKQGIGEFSKKLVNLNISLISTGGTAKTLQQHNIPYEDISTITGFPEMLDGRVKTLHPHIHGALLAQRKNKDHMNTLKDHHIKPIDMVVCNLYPFENTITKQHVSLEEIIENIDIGGPTLIRAAAKNYPDIVVITTP